MSNEFPDIPTEKPFKEALELHPDDKGFRRIFAIGDRNTKRTGAHAEDVETEIAAFRSERARKRFE